MQYAPELLTEKIFLKVTAFVNSKNLPAAHLVFNSQPAFRSRNINEIEQKRVPLSMGAQAPPEHPVWLRA
jgi:hypothetical protein